ncbi:restriction endonuclease subunit S [Pseudoalteromonas sp. Xi13]|uniref:restriction endonuclease subunit S n=1 Tax=Pseudoalteromonas sp. Xi13 TaxID=2490635 RepID=UPI000F75DB9F|nr:restriction endonuclease subunit S [Pseudoalteromonas sp. Xi13]AZN33973.1 restriction endonuclease subunit S [Pseudoalteromonas sp. Xi13]
MTSIMCPKTRFKEFKESWKKTKLNEYLYEISSGWSPQCESRSVEGDEWGVLTTTSTTWDGFDEEANKKLPESLTPKEHLKVNKGDILITRAGPVNRVGVVCRVNSQPKRNVMLSDKLIRIVTSEAIDSRFLAFYLKLPSVQNYFTCRKSGLAEAQSNISQDIIKKVPLAIPNINEQEKISDFFTVLDSKLSKLKEKYTLTIQYKKAVMQKLFKQELRFKDENGNAFPDWQEKKMGQVINPEIREIAKPNEKYLALGIRSHMKGTFQKPGSDPEAVAMDKLFVVRPNDLVVNITFAWEGAIAIAKVEDDGGLVSHRFPTYTFKKNEATHRFFKHIIQLKRFKYMLDLISPGGAGRNRVLSKSEFLKLKWDFPSVKEQEKIADFLDTLDKKLDALSEQIDLTQTFKKGLLQQMFV